MKFVKKYLIIIFFLITAANAEDKFVYVDMNFLMNKSKAGISSTVKISNDHKQKLSELKKIQEQLKNDETNIIQQKNILSKTEFNKKLELLRKKATSYQKERNKVNQSLNQKREQATSKLINLIRPLLAQYASDNSISIIFQKKDIIIGKTDLDITKKILEMLDNKHKTIKLD